MTTLAILQKPAMNEENDFPFRLVWLKPVPNPSASQIEFFHQRWGQRYGHIGNYFGSRKVLIRGGFPAFSPGRISEALYSLLRELDKLAIPYQVETLPIDRHGVVLRSIESPSQPNWLDLGESPPCYEGPRHVVIELSSVTTRDAFVEAMDAHFPCARDADKIWGAFHLALSARPFQVEFRGWKCFAKRMPRYARRIRNYVETTEKYGAAGFHAAFVD